MQMWLLMPCLGNKGWKAMLSSNSPLRAIYWTELAIMVAGYTRAKNHTGLKI